MKTLFCLLIPCAVLMVAGAGWFAPDEEDPVRPPAPPPNWARVGLADFFSAWLLRWSIEQPWPDPCKWIAVVCFASMAAGFTLGNCSEGKAWPD